MQSGYQKTTLRKKHIELRNAMDGCETAEKSSIICQRMLSSDWYVSSSVIYGYYPLGKEADPLPLLRRALADGKTVALPRTEPGSCRMDFYQVQDLTEVSEGAFHVMEPLQTCKLLVPTMTEEAKISGVPWSEQRKAAERLGISNECSQPVVLVPGVVFDKSGSRYGYGKGYYDRYFARFPQCRRYALAYEHQMETVLETLDTDVRMNRIYTDVRMYDFSE
jgi:5-formyltetrahydrofolate cyclo-ligase